MILKSFFDQGFFVRLLYVRNDSDIQDNKDMISSTRTGNKNWDIKTNQVAKLRMKAEGSARLAWLRLLYQVQYVHVEDKTFSKNLQQGFSVGTATRLISSK